MIRGNFIYLTIVGKAVWVYRCVNNNPMLIIPMITNSMISHASPATIDKIDLPKRKVT